MTARAFSCTSFSFCGGAFFACMSGGQSCDTGWHGYGRRRTKMFNYCFCA